MKRKLFFLVISLFLSIVFANNILAEDRIDLKYFYSSTCKACIKVKQQYLPQVISKYKDKINIEYINISEPENLKVYVALEKQFKKELKVPLILIGHTALIGRKQIVAYLETFIDRYSSGEFNLGTKLDLEKIDLLQKFSSFSFLTVIGAGLIDGINPCAFTVLIFFISFLTLMGYKKRGILAVGLTFILAVFLTYLAIGLGLFNGLYGLRQFYIFMRFVYYMTAGICFSLAYLNLRDFITYLKTKRTDSFSVKLPNSIRQRINSLISMFYRPESKEKIESKLSLIAGTFIVGFLVSLLEAVCTGQVYLPIIVFILKEPHLRIKALAYLLLYNFMFILPLLVILLVAIMCMGSKKLEEFFKHKIALIKIIMSIFFLLLGLFLLKGV
jgi:cytochrome c biogenesis protein CcdA